MRLCALGPEVFGDFVIADDRRTVSLGEGERVAAMVLMSVGKQHVVAVQRSRA